MRQNPSHPRRSASAFRRAMTIGFRTAVAAAFAVTFAACNDATSPGDSALEAAEARWKLLKPASGSYVMRQQVQCFCGFAGTEYAVTVTNGVVTAATAVSRPPEGFGPPPLTAFRTVDQLFTEVRNALRKSGTLKDVVYDSTAGFPARVSLDPIPNAVDDEVTYETRAVGPLP